MAMSITFCLLRDFLVHMVMLSRGFSHVASHVILDYISLICDKTFKGKEKKRKVILFIQIDDRCKIPPDFIKLISSFKTVIMKELC